ncbi:MAG: hypothetical protein K9G60_01725 [Pseudolabrys sp.]|nr:hypothetical protein [Pseudolabrys sp.]
MGGNFTFDRSLEEIFRLENETTNIASLLLNVAVQGLPYSESFALLKTDGKKELLISTFISDLYLYLLAHETGHIHCRHFDNKAVRRAATITGENVSKEETEADLYAFALVANAVGQETGNFRLYIHTSLIFHTMSFLYRALHYLHFGRDYGHLPPQVQRAIWFPPSNYYPHPQARLFSLRREIRDKASVVPAGLDQWDREIDAFFENLWKPICLKLTGADHPVGDMWRGELALHGLAYTSNGFKPS